MKDLKLPHFQGKIFSESWVLPPACLVVLAELYHHNACWMIHILCHCAGQKIGVFFQAPTWHYRKFSNWSVFIKFDSTIGLNVLSSYQCPFILSLNPLQLLALHFTVGWRSKAKWLFFCLGYFFFPGWLWGPSLRGTVGNVLPTCQGIRDPALGEWLPHGRITVVRQNFSTPIQSPDSVKQLQWARPKCTE